MSYTVLSLLGVAAVLLVDGVVLRTRLVLSRLFWTAYAIVLFCQLITNGILTGRRVVSYDPDMIVGLRVAYAPVEDVLFGFALTLLTLATWVWLGRLRPGTASLPAGGRRAPRRPW